jgi:hypothetical protein
MSPKEGYKQSCASFNNIKYKYLLTQDYRTSKVRFNTLYRSLGCRFCDFFACFLLLAFSLREREPSFCSRASS